MACNGDTFNLHKMGDMINTAIEVSEVSKELDSDISDTEKDFPDGLQTDKEDNCEEELQKISDESIVGKYEGRAQCMFPSHPTVSKSFIA